MFAEKNLRWSALLPALGLQLHAMILSAGIPRVLRLLCRELIKTLVHAYTVNYFWTIFYLVIFKGKKEMEVTFDYWTFA